MSSVEQCETLFGRPGPRVRTSAGGGEIYDETRRLWVRLTPEEWVRQSLIGYLREELGYPWGLMSVERLVEVNGMPQRADLVVNDRQGRAFLLVECKASSVQLSPEVLRQAARYNAVLQARYVALTNGVHSMVFDTIDPESWHYMGDSFPEYRQV